MKQYKIRNLTTCNATGNAYGITVPKWVADRFFGVYFTVECRDSCIIFRSGCR